MTGLLTSAQREFLRGNNDVEKPDQYLRNIRHRVRTRIDAIDHDLRLLDDAGEEELRAEFYAEFDRHTRLESEVEQLRSDVKLLEKQLSLRGEDV